MSNDSKHVYILARYGVFMVSVTAGVLLGLAACGGGGHHGGGVPVTAQQGPPPLTGKVVDRMGRPAIATTLVKGPRKNEFNASTPVADTAFRADAIDILSNGPYNNGGNAATIANTLFPDILTVDVALPTNYLNGRSLQDDVIDASLFILTNGAVTTDNVAAKPFLNVFPFMNTPTAPQ